MSRPSRWTVLMGISLAALVAAVCFGVVLGVRVHHQRAAQADRDHAIAAAKQVATDMIGINAQNAQSNIDRMLGVATNPFRDQLVGYSKVFQQIVSQGQVRASGGVDSAGVESIDGRTATVLISASTIVRNTQLPDGAPRNYRMVIGLRNEAGQWRVSSVDEAP